MSRIRLYFDEDAMQQALVVALRARRVEVLIASDCGMVNRSDEEHLRRASSDERVLYSFNMRTTLCSTSSGSPGDKHIPGSFSRCSSGTRSANNCGGCCTF